MGVGGLVGIWWRGRSANADLILLLVHLIKQHRAWEGATVRLLQVITNDSQVEQTRIIMEQLLEQVRVKAEPVVIVRPASTKPITKLLAEWSHDADLSMLGIKLPEGDQVESYSKRLDELVNAVGTVLLVRNAQVDEDLLSTG